MSKKQSKKTNDLDKAIEQLTKEFLKIPNFNLINEDEIANKAFNTISYRMNELISYRNLVCMSYVPAVNKVIFETKKQYQKSKYKQLIDIKESDFNEMLYDTIRLAYVGLFHKIENYMNDVIKLTDLIFKDVFENKESITTWAKQRFNFKIKDWKNYMIPYKVNWICNCVKHSDGYPTKEPKPLIFQHSNENNKIQLTVIQFKNDCNYIIEFYIYLLKAIFALVQHKIAVERMTFIEENIKSEEYVELKNKFEKMEEAIKGMLKNM